MPASDGPAPSRPHRAAVTAGLAGAHAVLFVVSFPGLNLWPLAFAAPLPLLWLAIGAATTPYYGYGLKAFPDAMTMPGFMQVRVVKAGVTELLSHVPSIWQGTYKSPNFIDFLVQKVHFTFSETMPLQIGGDAEGYRKEIALEVSETTVDFLDFSSPTQPTQPTA